MGVNWARLSAESHYQVAVEIEGALLQGNFDEAEAGIKELINALGRSEKRALKGQLVRLMAHIVKWKTQSERRTVIRLGSNDLQRKGRDCRHSGRDTELNWRCDQGNVGSVPSGRDP